MNLFENDAKSKFKQDSNRQMSKLSSKTNLSLKEDEKFKKAPEELEREYQVKKNRLMKLQEEY